MMDQAEALARDLFVRGSGAPVYRLSGHPAAAVAGHSGAAWLNGLPCSVAIGAFDGLHIGHAELLRLAVEDARARGIASVAVTFDPDPDVVVCEHPSPKLLLCGDRLRALSVSGVDFVLVVPFTESLSSLDHIAFFDTVLSPALDVRSIHVGSDFRLGAHGASTVEVIRRWGLARGIDVHGHDLVLSKGVAVSATRIRSSLASGGLDSVLEGLGRRFYIKGEVCRGRGEGTGMGFPTANISVPDGIALPLEGVYAGWGVLSLPDGALRAWPAAINVGVPPMFAYSSSSAKLEANLIGFDGDLYGSELAIVFDTYLRKPVSLGSVAELIETVNNDIASTERLFGCRGIEVRA